MKYLIGLQKEVKVIWGQILEQGTAITVLFCYNFQWDMNSTLNLELNIQGNTDHPLFYLPAFVMIAWFFSGKKSLSKARARGTHSAQVINVSSKEGKNNLLESSCPLAHSRISHIFFRQRRNAVLHRLECRSALFHRYQKPIRKIPFNTNSLESWSIKHSIQVFECLL